MFVNIFIIIIIIIIIRLCPEFLFAPEILLEQTDVRLVMRLEEQQHCYYYLQKEIARLRQHHRIPDHWDPSLIAHRPFSKMAAEYLNKSKLKTNTSTRKSILN